MYTVTDSDLPLLREYRTVPRKQWSIELRRLLNRLMIVPNEERVVIVALTRRGPWQLCRRDGVRGRPFLPVDDRVFDSLADAQWEALKHRWLVVTGKSVPPEYDEEVA
ncbi:hypothetical protein [Rhodosalinus sp. FB01]|uniref:hypothetical protein n=1 Tax=Rhodosalinus sp. FB01 TaxID=3239194 RepID=UPI003525C52E